MTVIGNKRFTWDVEPHDPRLYTPAEIATPVHGLEAIDDEVIRRYNEDGFIAIEDAFTPEEVESARQGILDLVAGRVPKFDCIEFEAHAKEKVEQLQPEERQDYVRKLMSFVKHEQRLRAIAHHPKLISVLECILGVKPELFQDMALLKPPMGREKPWHQDNAYFDIPLDTHIVGVWIALDEVAVENGCMHLLKGGHRIGPIPHFQIRDWQLCDREMLGRPAVAVPLRPGGCLIFNGMLPHGTPRNNTNQRRRAIQYHYCPAGVRKVDPEVRLGAFGSEGKDVSC